MKFWRPRLDLDYYPSRGPGMVRGPVLRCPARRGLLVEILVAQCSTVYRTDTAAAVPVSTVLRTT